MTPPTCVVLPNLGAEEGDDWRGWSREPATRVAARLWTHLFSQSATLRSPRTAGTVAAERWQDQSMRSLWPTSLGSAPTEPVYPWLEPADAIVPWFSTPAIEALADEWAPLRLAGPDSRIVQRVHDKSFALESARALDLLPDSLAPLIYVIEADALRSPDRLLTTLAEQLRSWPEWTRKRFTLKPRLGSSGRGRVAGAEVLDTPALRGALPRLLARGGALFEPWLDRVTDLSVCLYLPPASSDSNLPTLLGSLEMLATPSGLWRGHCGEVDSRGRVFSGHPEDESLRGAAAAVAGRAGATGFFGGCGIDAFTYREGERERTRPAVEFNARPTMGLVALGLIRRCLPSVREALQLTPGERRGFLLALLPADRPDLSAAIAREADSGCAAIPLATIDDADTPLPFLFFAPELEPLRQAYRRHIGC